MASTFPVVINDDPAVAADCPSARVYGVRGSDEKRTDAGGFGNTVAAVLRSFYNAHPTATGAAIDYPAVPILHGGLNYGAEYARSIAAGQRTLASTIERWVAGPCGATTPVFLVGYSQGAHVVADTYQGRLSQRAKSRVLGLALIGDPRFKGGQATPVNRGTYDRRRNGVYDIPGTPRVWRAAEAQVARSYCTAGDPVCNVTVNSLVDCRIHPRTCPHANYTRLPSSANSYTAQAARWLASHVPDAVPDQSEKVLTVGPLTMGYPTSSWSEVDYGVDGPGQDSVADDMTNTAPCGNCDTVPTPQVAAFVQVYRTTWCADDAHCLPSEDVTGAAPPITIGGETPSSSAAWTENGGQYRGMGWCFASKQVCVTYRRATDVPLTPSAALLQLFATARWS